MSATPRQRFLAVQVLSMLALLCGMILVGRLRVDLFLVASLVGFVLLLEYTSPFVVRPPWRLRLRPVVVAGFAAFAVYALFVTYSRIAWP